MIAARHIPSLAGALAKAAGAMGRRVGWGRVAPNWEARAAVCEQCVLRVVRCGMSYCGKPYLAQIERDLVSEGCGCPCHEKAKTPGEHCPIDSRHQAADKEEAGCTCKWCVALDRVDEKN
jgi:hypothetical protein